MMDRSSTAFEPPIPELNWKMPVEVMRDFDTVLLFGQLTAVGPEDLTIRRTSNEARFPVLERESIVLVRCYNGRMDPVILRARVTRSSDMDCTVGRLEVIPCKTRRRHVRYPLCPPAEIAVLRQGEPEKPLPCQMLNISMDGACIVTKCVCDVGQAVSLRLKMEKEDECAPCPCQVTRATPRQKGYYEYGLLFGPLDKARRSSLTGALNDWLYMSFGGGAEE